VNPDQSARAWQIFERHFRSLNAYDRFLSDMSFVEPRLKRFAHGLTSEQISVMFGRELTHINYPTFRQLLQAAQAFGTLRIFETGSSAYGTNSSALFAQLAMACSGTFTTVDLNPQTAARVAQLFEGLGCGSGVRAVCADSLAYLARTSVPFNVVYLDSYDLLPEHFVAAENHGWNEFRALLSRELLAPEGALVLVDDTPRTLDIMATQVDDSLLGRVREHIATHGRMPGKGALIARHVASDPRFEILAWEYQLLVRLRARG
jgi:hypothetical protein